VTDRGCIRNRGNPKSQAPNPKEISISNDQRGRGIAGCFLRFEVWFLEFVWELGFGTWDFQL
jgi:hypothetical protein